MDEETTTAVQTETEAGSPDVEESQAEGQSENAAEESDSETQAEPSVDDEDAKWLRNKGIDPDDPEATKKAAKLARDTEREFHKSRQEAKTSLRTQAKAAVQDDGNSALENEVRQLRVAQQVTEFRSGLRDQGFSKDQIDEIDSNMADLIVKKPYLANDLETVYALVRSSKYESDLKAAEEKGRQAARQATAKASAAKAPSGNAQSRKETEKKDPFLEGFNNAF